jgi:hypothetical protein
MRTPFASCSKAIRPSHLLASQLCERMATALVRSELSAAGSIVSPCICSHHYRQAAWCCAHHNTNSGRQRCFPVATAGISKVNIWYQDVVRMRKGIWSQWWPSKLVQYCCVVQIACSVAYLARGACSRFVG